MNDSRKNIINWICFGICVLGLIFIIFGLSTGITPLMISILEQNNLAGLYFSVLCVAYALFFQVTILFLLYRHIKNKGITKRSKSIKKIIIILILSSFFFILLSGILIYAEQSIPISGQLLFFSPIITLIAGLFAKDYKTIVRKKEKRVFSILLFIFYDLPIIVFPILIIIVIIISYFSDPISQLFFILIIGLAVDLLIEWFIWLFLFSFFISLFIFNLGVRSQLLTNKRNLYSTASIISSIAAFFLPYSIEIQFLFAGIFSVVISIILKYIFIKRLHLGEIRELIKLEPGKDLLNVKDFKVFYPLIGGIFRRQIGVIKAVNSISFEIKIGETLGLVGESGCGKTTAALGILGLVEKNNGEVLFHDKPLSIPYSSFIRQKIQIVYQDPDASLNPRLKVFDIIAEPLKNLLGIKKKDELRKKVLELMKEVALKREHMDRYPHEFSGGQKQRIVIARALATNPELIILDEPTSALDVSVQAQILNLLKKLQKNYGYGYLFITHNLAAVNHIADRIAVMYLGQIVEIGDTEQVFSKPSHPYTQALLASRSEVDMKNRDIKFIIRGEVPSLIAPPTGCAFHPRCSSDVRTKECEFDLPHKIKIEEGHYIWCINPPKQ